MLKKTLTPVVLVAGLWITMSTATTFYVQWLERSHQRFISENIVSIRAAGSLQLLVWRLAAECPDDPASLPAFRRRWNDASGQLAFERERLGQSAITAEEKQALVKVDQSLTSFRDNLESLANRRPEQPASTSPTPDLVANRQKVIDLAGQLAAVNGDLSKIIQADADRDERRVHRIGRNVMAFRFTMLAIGPLFGVFLGWRLARHLHHSIAIISVTLHDAGSKVENDIGTVAIESSGDFQDVQQQAEQVAEKMRQVSRDLQIARREVLQSERLAAVGELAAGVAHEIRNPLTSVKLLLQHAIRQSSGPNLDENKLRLILEEIGRMESTIQGLLDFSRPPKLNRVTHDFRQTLKRALNLIDARARQQGIIISTQIDDHPLMVDGDTEKLHQVLVNLLINAIEAMPNGGRLSITAEVSSPGQRLSGSGVTLPNGWDGETVQIFIRDTGEGIPAELLPRLFEPFATSKERGTGLGLAVSRRIVEEHHGTIHASNDPTGGAQFLLSIPAASSTVLSQSLS